MGFYLGYACEEVNNLEGEAQGISITDKPQGTGIVLNILYSGTSLSCFSGSYVAQLFCQSKQNWSTELRKIEH